MPARPTRPTSLPGRRRGPRSTTLPSFLISACNYVDGSGDLKWARANYDKLAAWGREMFAADKDGNGLIEYPGTGNFGDRPKTDRRPANWWDCINFGHEDAFANALAYRGATMFAELARKLNHAEDARFFSEKAAKLRAAYAPDPAESRDRRDGRLEERGRPTARLLVHLRARHGGHVRPARRPDREPRHGPAAGEDAGGRLHQLQHRPARQPRAGQEGRLRLTRTTSPKPPASRNSTTAATASSSTKTAARPAAGPITPSRRSTSLAAWRTRAASSTPCWPATPRGKFQGFDPKSGRSLRLARLARRRPRLRGPAGGQLPRPARGARGCEAEKP